MIADDPAAEAARHLALLLPELAARAEAAKWLQELLVELEVVLQRSRTQLEALGVPVEFKRGAVDAVAVWMRSAAKGIEATGPLNRAERRRRHRHGG